MSDQFVAEIRIVPYTFAPSGWAFCSGQILPISQNTALFSLLGTYYGGNGQSNFALPNLNGHVPIGTGAGQGLTERYIGESGGVESVSLLTSEIPVHGHNVQAHAEPGDLRAPMGSALAISTDANIYGAVSGGTTLMNPAGIGVAGQGLPHSNLQPYVTVSFCIALQGIFPSRG